MSSWPKARKAMGVAANTDGLRVLIHTFPPNTNANYGGIIQAWALQRALTRLGHVALLNSTRLDRRPPWRKRLLSPIRALLAATVPWRMTPRGLRQKVYGEYLNQRLYRFASEEIEMVKLFDAVGDVRRPILEQFDAFVVGSDQVWRPAYAPVESYLLGFLPDSFSGPRVAYAASFGTDTPEFNDALRASTSRFAKRLTAISVREDSGAELCRRLWGVEAVQMPDPTLLIGADEYRELARRGTNASASGQLFAYVLDGSTAVSATVDALSKALTVPARWLTAAQSTANISLLTRANKLVKPGVHEWLGLISTAEYVMTDSYHGCVFSVIFERQFLVALNERRGAARFHSFLSLVGLSDRIVDRSRDIGEQMLDPIDWAAVRQAVSRAQADAMEFLEGSLRAPDSRQSLGS